MKCKWLHMVDTAVHQGVTIWMAWWTAAFQPPWWPPDQMTTAGVLGVDGWQTCDGLMTAERQRCCCGCVWLCQQRTGRTSRPAVCTDCYRTRPCFWASVPFARMSPDSSSICALIWSACDPVILSRAAEQADCYTSLSTTVLPFLSVTQLLGLSRFVWQVVAVILVTVTMICPWWHIDVQHTLDLRSLHPSASSSNSLNSLDWRMSRQNACMSVCGGWRLLGGS